MPSPTDTPLIKRFDALSTLESLLQGIVEFVPALLWSLFVLPFLFFTRNPFEAISHARSTQKVLPPLLFLFLATIPTLLVVSYMGVSINSIDRQADLDQLWKTLTAGKVSEFLIVVGPPLVAAWICIGAVARLLSMVTFQSVDSARTVLLYLTSLCCSYFSITIFVIFASIKRPDGTVAMPELLAVPLSYFLEVFPVMLLMAAAIQIGRQVWVRFKGRNLLTKFSIVTGVYMSMAVAVLSMGALSLSGWSFLEGTHSYLLNEYELDDQKTRTSISVDTHLCRLKLTNLKCLAMIRSILPIDMQLVDLQSVSIKTRHQPVSGQPPESEESFLKHVKFRPAIEQGEPIKIPQGQQTLLAVELPANALCVQHFRHDQPSDNHFVVFSFIGFTHDSKTPARNLEYFRPMGLHLEADVIEALKGWCETANPLRNLRPIQSLNGTPDGAR